MINIEKRTRDMFYENEDLVDLYTLKRFPIYMGVTEESVETDEYADMEWKYSKNSGLIQLGSLIPDDVLYKKSHNSGIGKVWNEHYIQFSLFLNKYINKKSIVVELGGGNGILNSIYFTQCLSSNEWFIIEPSSVEPVVGCKASYIRKLWNHDILELNFYKDYKKNKDVVLVHTHVFEHLLSIIDFMETVSDFLCVGQKMIFSIPNLTQTLARKYSNALNFEHTYFITEEYIESILARYCFKVIDKSYFREEHSVFYAVEKTSQTIDYNLDIENLKQRNIDIFNGFIQYYSQIVEEFNKKLEKTSESIYLFGAHIFSQYLIQFGLDTKKIIKILDNDVNKQEKRLYGSNLEVASPKILEGLNQPIVILKVASYADEIKEDILSNINPTTIFWE